MGYSEVLDTALLCGGWKLMPVYSKSAKTKKGKKIKE
jgi:hypothetical protein